jgi:uncharacterized integral membrane protein (TIGR00697 family)
MSASTDPQHAHLAHALTPAQRLYMWLSAVSVACLIVGDLLGVKLFKLPLGFEFSVFWADGPIDSITHTCGMLTFPITFLITDLANEYYGRKAARRIVYVSFAMGFVSFAAMNVALAMPHWDVPFNVREGSFQDVFANSRVMFVASLTAYLIGSLADVFLFARFKRLTGGKMVWLRATGSTVVSQLVDSFVVTYLAFGLGRQLFPSGTDPMPFNEILKTAATGYMLKFVIAIGITPVIYLGRFLVERFLGLKPLPPDAQR